MGTFKDVLLVIGIVLAILGGLLALPFIAFAIFIIAMGWVLYAHCHDERLKREEAKNVERAQPKD